MKPVTVVFRKWPDTGEIIALFPDILGDAHGVYCSSYMHTGQHASATTQIVRKTRPASRREYRSLARELRAAPYHYRLRIATRINHAVSRRRRWEAFYATEGGTK